MSAAEGAVAAAENEPTFFRLGFLRVPPPGCASMNCL
jgi:hypothetical protein